MKYIDQEVLERAARAAGYDIEIEPAAIGSTKTVYAIHKDGVRKARRATIAGAWVWIAKKAQQQ